MEEFIGREKQINDFWNIYNDSYESCKIINYYGMTGMGKTSLINNLENQLNLKNLPFIKIDMDYCMKKDINTWKNVQDREEILTKMRNQLIDKYKYKFKNFDKTLFNYYISIGLPESSPEIQILLKKNSGLKDQLIDLAKDVFSSQACLISGAKVIKTIGSTILDKLDKNQELQDSQDLYKKIITDFSTDLEENMKKSKEKLVIFIDTYEMLLKENIEKGINLVSDYWLKNGIVNSSNNILWVIAGRDKLNWSDKEFKIQKYKLPFLSKTESITFLNNAGIVDKTLCNKIYENSKGLPMYLSLCIDQYNILKKENETIDISMFGNNLDELTDNIIRNLSIEDQEILSYLSCIDNWNNNFIRDYGSKFITCFSYIRYSNLKNRSFINQNDDKNYSIINIAKNLLYDRCDENIKIIVKSNLAKFYQEQIQREDLEIEELIDLLYKYSNNNIILEENDEIAIENLRTLEDKLDYIKTYRKYDDIVNILENILSRFFDYRNILEEIGNLLIKGLISAGKHDIAKKYLPDYEILFKNDTNSENYINFIKLKSRILLETHEEEKAIAMLEEEYVKNPENTIIKEQLALAYGRRNDDEGKNKAINLLYELLQSNLSSESKDFIKRNIANIYVSSKKYKRAIEIYDELLSKTDNQLTIAFLEHNKATPYSFLGANEGNQEYHNKSLECIEKAYKIKKDILGKNNLSTLSSLNVKANTLANMNRHNEAIELYNIVYNQRKDILGENSYSTIQSLNNLAKTYYYKGDYTKALELLTQLQISFEKSNFSYKNDRIINAKTYIGATYIKLNNIPKGLEYIKEALKYDITYKDERVIDEVKNTLKTINQIDLLNKIDAKLQNLSLEKAVAN